MARTKAQKQEMLAEVKEAIKGSKSLVFVNFHGLSVANATEARKSMKKSDVGFLVTKKTLAKKALAEAGFSGELPELAGEFALAYGVDQTAPAREVFTFQKKFDKKISILGGVFDGRFMNAAEMTGIATIPSREVLYAQFVNLINSPIQRFAVVLSQIAGTKGSAAPAVAEAPVAATAPAA